MKKLSRAIQLLWKAHKKELKLKEEIKNLNHMLNLETVKYVNEQCISNGYKEEINRLKNQIAQNGHIIRFYIQKYIPPYNLDPSDYEIKLSDEYFKGLMEDCINKYAKDNNLFIKDVKYVEHGYVLTANVLFTDIPNELYVL